MGWTLSPTCSGAARKGRWVHAWSSSRPGLAGCGSDDASAARITTEDIAYKPSSITAESVDVSFEIENKDAVVHNLTVSNSGVDTDVQPGTTGTFKADLDPGTYTFVCKYHPDQMKGTLTLT